MKHNSQINRAIRLIKRSIEVTQLDLSGLTVLTEVGSNHFMYTPIIAALAGAKKVYAWTKDTSYGNAQDIVNDCNNIIEQLNINGVIEFSINERPREQVSEANIITNLGFVRPIDKEFIDHMSPNAVISYMCEAWEIRPGDVDIKYLQLKKNKVAGTWENFPGLKIFDGCGYLITKLCFEAGFEIYQNDILIISNDHFGEAAFNSLKNLQPNNIVLSSIDNISTNIALHQYDFIVIADYTSKEVIIGKYGKVSSDSINDSSIIHLCGNIDSTYCNERGIHLYPNKDGYKLRMTETLAYLGMKPLIDLHTAGLKVGENLIKNIESDLNQLIL